MSRNIERFPIKKGTSWSDINEIDYHPPYFVSPVLSGKDWADPEDLSRLNKTKYFSYEGEIKLDSLGRPLNPRGPTGLGGRGVLGKWGANFAADPIVTRINQAGFLELITIKRSDCGLWALPGGMVDPGERVTATLSRELGEETSACLNFDNAIPVYQGYVNDPRNTDHAWMETDAYHLHITTEQSESIILKGLDDADDSKWMVCSQENTSSLYANHSEFVDLAISGFQSQYNCQVLENGQVIFH